MAEQIVVFGAGGHSRTVVSILQECGHFLVAGVADYSLSENEEEILGVSVSFEISKVDEIFASGISYAALAIGDNNKRKDLFLSLAAFGYKLPAIIHPSANLTDSSNVGTGSQVCLGVKMGALSVVGQNSILNTGTIIDHETRVGDHVHIAPGCSIAGRVVVHDNVFIGIGSTIIDHISVGKDAIIGAGSVVLQDVPERCLVGGIPARVIKRL